MCGNVRRHFASVLEAGTPLAEVPPAQNIDIRDSASYSQCMASLPNNISSLSEGEKFELLDAIWEDLEAHTPMISAEQAEELDRRIAAYEKNPPTGTPWAQVKAGLPKR